MKQFLEKLKDARTAQRNYPGIFDDSNVRSLFGMLDVTGKGFITYEQYKQGTNPFNCFVFIFMNCEYFIINTFKADAVKVGLLILDALMRCSPFIKC